MSRPTPGASAAARRSPRWPFVPTPIDEVPPRLPPPDDLRDRAFRRAAELVVLGNTREVRRAFAAALARRATGEAAWLGSLVTSLLRSTQPRKRRRGQAR